jgi:Domain of Unknown Function with PDB structure (DUF3857)/Transglutaminase-like superfamily
MRCAIFRHCRAYCASLVFSVAAIASVAGILGGSAVAQSAATNAQSTVPSATHAAGAQKTTSPGAAKPGDFTKEALVFDKLYTRVREEADGTGTRQTTARIRILADAGVKDMAVLTFTYTASSEQVDVAYVRVIKPDGSVVVTPDYNTQDMPADVTRDAPMYSDVHQKHVTVKGLGVGDILEYQVTFRTLKPDVPGQFWYEYTFEKNLIVLDEQLDIDLPAGETVNVASAEIKPTVTSTGDRKLYHWASSNLSRPDPDAPPKSTKDWKPSVQVTTFKSWEEVGAWYASLQKNQLAVTPAIQAHADSLTKGLTSNEDKVQAIFNDVALHIHYVGLDFGIGRYQPHPADDVLSNEYGDCKDKHTLLAALLKAAGIEAWPVLIPSSRDLDPAVPSPAQFDHVITLVPLNGKLLWMDSTEEIAPIGVLVATLRDKQALAIPVNKPAYLEHTPSDLPYLQSTRFDVKGKLSEQGEFDGHIEQTYHGDAELVMRSVFRSIPQSQWKEFIQGFSNNTGFAGEVKSPNVSAIEQLSTPLHFSYDYTREKYGDWGSHRISPPLPPIGFELPPGVKQVKPADDVDLGSPGVVDYTASVQLPDGWAVYPPHSTDVSEDWAEYHAEYAYSDGTFTAERRLVVKKDKMPLSQWDKYLAFRRSVYDDETLTSALSNPGETEQFQSALDASVAPYLLSENNPGNFSADSKRQIQAILDPLRTATEILEGNNPPSTADVAKAVSISQKAVGDVESLSLNLHPEDAHALYLTQLLSYAWSTMGWSALEANNLPTAEKYLRSAWKLSHDRITGYQFGRLLEVKGDKIAAAHEYELAHVTTILNPLGGFLGSKFNVDDHLAASYLKLTGRELKVTAFNHGAYNGSLQAELDKETAIRPLTRSSKLTGSGLYSVAFEEGKPIKVSFLGGDNGFASIVPALQAHAFPSELPTGSKAMLLREVRVVCSPYAGCDAEILMPTSIDLPRRSIAIDVTPPDAPKGTKTVRVINVPAQP